VKAMTLCLRPLAVRGNVLLIEPSCVGSGTLHSFSEKHRVLEVASAATTAAAFVSN
jgi:hypothetical protein